MAHENINLEIQINSMPGKECPSELLTVSEALRSAAAQAACPKLKCTLNCLVYELCSINKFALPCLNALDPALFSTSGIIFSSQSCSDLPIQFHLEQLKFTN